MEKYKSLELIARGGYSEVYRCEDANTGKLVAIKWIPFENKSGGLPYEVLREISVLKELNHVNVVRLLDVVDEKDRFGLVFEDMGDNLAEYIRDHPYTTLFPRERKRLLFQILQGVAYCHSEKVLHRDLQTQNVLVDIMRQTIKLADFGRARTFDVSLPKYSMDVTSYGCRPPEVLVSREYSSAADIWAVGCIFAEMVTSKPLFDGKTDIEIMVQIFRMFGNFGLPDDEVDWPAYFKLFNFKQVTAGSVEDLADRFPELETEGLDLLSKMLCVDPKRRITALDALQHPYFRDVQVDHLVEL